MSQTGQQHPKADSGGQRPADSKKGDAKETGKGSTKEAMAADKVDGAKKDAKK